MFISDGSEEGKKLLKLEWESGISKRYYKRDGELFSRYSMLKPRGVSGTKLLNFRVFVLGREWLRSLRCDVNSDTNDVFIGQEEMWIFWGRVGGFLVSAMGFLWQRSGCSLEKQKPWGFAWKCCSMSICYLHSQFHEIYLFFPLFFISEIHKSHHRLFHISIYAQELPSHTSPKNVRDLPCERRWKKEVLNVIFILNYNFLLLKYHP